MLNVTEVVTDLSENYYQKEKTGSIHQLLIG